MKEKQSETDEERREGKKLKKLKTKSYQKDLSFKRNYTIAFVVNRLN